MWVCNWNGHLRVRVVRVLACVRMFSVHQVYMKRRIAIKIGIYQNFMKMGNNIITKKLGQLATEISILLTKHNFSIYMQKKEKKTSYCSFFQILFWLGNFYNNYFYDFISCLERRERRVGMGWNIPVFSIPNFQS